MLPVAVPDQHGDGGTQGLARAHTRQPFDMVRFDLHAGAASVPPLAALELRVHIGSRHGETGGDPFEDAHEAAAVRLACRCEAECHRYLLLSSPPDQAEGSKQTSPTSSRARHTQVPGEKSPESRTRNHSWRSGRGERVRDTTSPDSQPP